MSFNIDKVTVLKSTAWMLANDVHRLLVVADDVNDDGIELPELNFLRDELGRAAKQALKEGDPERHLPIHRFWWCSQRSGDSYEEVLIAFIAPLIHGRIEAVFTWERGESLSGLIIDEGAVTKCDVQLVLVPQVKS